MFKHTEKPAKWGRYRVHTATGRPCAVSMDYTDDYDPELESCDALPFEDDKKDLPEKPNTCVRIAYQRALVSVPVAVRPISYAGPANTLCCSDPVVTSVRCTGNKEKICYFTISQEICVEVPVHFGATAKVGEPGVDCLGTSLDDCEDCMENDA